MPTIDDLTTPEYRALLRERYARPGWGGSGYHHAEEVANFAFRIGAHSILDYGCGRGTLTKALLEADSRFDHREYDPGIIGKDALPQPTDLLVATDVLEHIEPDCLLETLRFMRRLTLKGAFFIIAQSPAKEVLADGRNAHLLIKPTDWWIKHLRDAGFQMVVSEQRKGLWVWCRD